MISLLLLLMLKPSQLAGEMTNGCFTKEGWQAQSRTAPDPTSHKEVASLSDCARYCSNDLDGCDGFNFYPNKPKDSPNCYPRQGAYLKAQDSSAGEVITAGWCPNNKGLSSADRQAIQPSPLQCSSSGDICQFPVNVRGVLHWDCVDREGVKVCNAQDPQSANKIQTFDSLDTFEACEKCDSDGCIKADTNYVGFALLNKDKTNLYKDVESENDCQKICQLAEGCNFFNFKNKGCWLKYRVGTKNVPSLGNFFGPKYCPVDCVAGNSTRSLGSCNATCGVKGRRKVSLIPAPVELSPAQYGGNECKKEEVVEVEEDCTGDYNCLVDCVAGNSTRSPDPCNATCGAEGIRRVRLTPEAEILAKYKGAECEKDVVEENCTGECSPTTSTAVAISTTVALLALLVIGIIIFLVCKRQKTSKEQDTQLTTELSSCDDSKTDPGPGPKDPALPSHSVLQKDDSLKEKVKELAANTKLLDSEFERLGKFVKENVVKESEVAAREENKPHNRYLDIVPFDDNVIILDSELFTTISEIDYINASRIKFEDCPQEFIAAQAPKKVSFDHFWHMVIQEKVTVIVMITRLLEKKKRKADQYWPDQDQPAMELGGGGRLELVSTSYQGSYFLRKFTLSLADGRRHEVTQLHSENWPDLEAPEDPRVLVDMVHKSQELLNWKPGTLLVHCSAGVGRTGTFLALYKLWLDYQDGSCSSLALLPTVLALRRQRCLMVQKPKQYSYIVSCLSMMVSAEEGDYYEIVENV